MPVDLDALETRIKSNVTGLTNVLNVSFAPTQVVGFVAEGIFKAIRLGRTIKAAQKRRSEDLETRIRARGVLRTPISADLSDLDFLSFYSSAFTLLAFPLLQQLEPEIREMEEKRLNAAVDTLRKLKVARQLAPILKDDPKLEKPDHRDLHAIFAISLTPDGVDFRALVSEYVLLFPEVEQTYHEHYLRMQGFWTQQLALSVSIEVQRISGIQSLEQRQLDQEVRAAVQEAVAGEEGFAAKALDLAVKLKRDALQEEVDRLTESRAESDNPALTDELIAALKSHLERLTG